MSHRTTHSSKPLVLATVSIFTVVLASACGKPENKNIPKKVAEMGPGDSRDAEVNAREKLWDNFAKALGIGNNQAASQTALEAQLGTPSTLASNVTHIQKIGAAHAAAAFATRCASIESILKLGPAKKANGEALAKSDLYLMKFKLQKDATGAAEDTARNGLLVLPNDFSQIAYAPIVAYGHGGDQGLSYSLEFAAVFDELQDTHIIVAPPFPGEPICQAKSSFFTKKCDKAEEVIAEAQGKSEPFRTDVDELLGMQDCVARAARYNPAAAMAAQDSAMLSMPEVDTTGASIGSKNALLSTIVKRQGGTGLAKSLPVSYVAGASRGGLVANLALAKTGAALTPWQKGLLGTAYPAPSLFNCAFTFYPPSTFAHGEFRIVLEDFVKGNAKNTNAFLLPAARQLDEYFAAYGKGAMTADQAALEISKMDSLISSSLVVGALQNWSKFVPASATAAGSAAPGAMLLIHGLFDSVVPVSQSLLGGGAFKAASSALTAAGAAPGIALTAVGFVPTGTYANTNGTLKSGSQHGDLAFATSQAATDLLSAKGKGPTTVQGTPAEVVRAWLQTGECATARTP